MKRLLLFACIILAAKAHAFEKDTVVYVKGYYITSYNEQEILDRIIWDELRRQNRSHFVPIDFHFYSNQCFSLHVNEATLLTASDIAPLLGVRNIIWNFEIFKFPPYKRRFFSDIITNHNPLKAQSEEIINKRIDFSPAEYYKLAGYKEPYSSVHQIYYIEGWALRTKVDTDYLDLANQYEKIQFYFGIPPIPNNSIASFYMYMFYQLDIIDPNRPPAGFVKWEPVITDEDLDKYEKEVIRDGNVSD